MEQRATKLIVIVGFNGTGKTTLTEKLVNNELKKPTGRALIVTPDVIEWQNMQYADITETMEYFGAKRTIFRRSIYKGNNIAKSGTIDYINKNYFNGLAVFDDCRAYINAATENDLHRLMIRRRQHGIDIIACTHGFTEVPPVFFTFASDFIIFRTQDNVAKRKQELYDFDKILEISNRINERAKAEPHYYEHYKR